MSHAAAVLATPPSNPSAGGRLVAADGRALPLTGTRLTAHAAGGLCRVLLEQRFHNPHAEPLRVTYRFPLPHDGAVSGFAFTLGGRRVVGEVDRLRAARERFERALVEGRTAGLLEQVRGSVFTQELGNVPGGAEVVAEITVDQRLAWLPEGAWEWRFPTAVAPRYMGAPGRVADAGRLQVDVAEGGVPVRLTLSLEVADPLAEGGVLSSPTHPLRVARGETGLGAALAAAGGAPLDRDVAIRWPVAASSVGATLQVAHPPAGSRLAGRSFGLVTLLPPRREAVRAVARDLIVLLDTSGSMTGAPLDLAREVVASVIGSLGDEDRLELIEFSSVPRRWKAGPVQATAAARRQALAWLAGLEAGGCTEMGDALLEALAPLRPGAQRQVVLVTDGEIAFEDEVLATLRDRLPAGSRLHTVGVGSAVNRSLTAPTARAGRGVEVLIGLGEAPSAAAARLLAHTAAPVVTELSVTGDGLVRPASTRFPDLMAGAPALLPVELAPGGGTITVRGVGAGGAFERVLRVAGAPGGSAALPALFAREAVEELELAGAGGGPRREVDPLIEQLGLDFQISTRLTSWVADSEEPTVDPLEPTWREVVPQALPHGMSVAGLGLRACAPAPSAARASMAPSAHFDGMMSLSEAGPGELELAGGSAAPEEEERFDEPSRLRRSSGGPPRPSAAPPSPPPPPPLAGPPAMKEELGGLARPAPERRLAARVVLREGDRLVVEFEVTGAPLAWDPSTFLRLAGAPRTGCVVDLAASTAAGEVAPGRTVRLVLRLAPSAVPGLLRRGMPARPGAIHFSSGLVLEPGGAAEPPVR